MLHDTALIANGASQSNTIEVSERVVVGIFVPSAWTAATLTFLGSFDGTNFFPVYDAAGTELEVQAAASRLVAIPPDATRSLRYLKVRSGNLGTPVNQGADRTIMLAIANDTAS